MQVSHMSMHLEEPGHDASIELKCYVQKSSATDAADARTQHLWRCNTHAATAADARGRTGTRQALFKTKLNCPERNLFYDKHTPDTGPGNAIQHELHCGRQLPGRCRGIAGATVRSVQASVQILQHQLFLEVPVSNTWD